MYSISNGMNFKKIALLSLLWFILAAAGCQSSTTKASLGALAVTTQIRGDNSPMAELAVIVDNVPQIYVSAQIINARRGDKVDVIWKYLPTNQTMATEIFTGHRTSDRPTEFVGGARPVTSYLASKLILSDISWPVGDYQVTVRLNQGEEKQVGFSVTTEQKYDIELKKAMVQNLWLGTQINEQNQIISPSTKFNKTDNQIYAVALLKGVPVGTQIKGSWKMLSTNEELGSFLTTFSDGGYLPFELTLDQLGRTIWPKGSYLFTLSVDNLVVATKNFSIS